MKVVAAEETSELIGSGVIDEILRWMPESVTYRHLFPCPDGPCIESDIKNSLAYEDVEVPFAEGIRDTVKSCRAFSCSGELLCTENP